MSESPNRPNNRVDQKKTKEEAELNQFAFFISLCLFPAIICGVLGAFIYWNAFAALKAGGTRLTDLGNFGSYLQGTTGSLWAFSGVFIIFVAFLMQMRQLAEQRAQFRIQEASIKRQNFENKFFQLLTFHHTLVQDMKAQNSSGRECFRIWYDRLKYLRDKMSQTTEYLAASVKGEMNERLFSQKCYDGFYKSKQGELGHYFRNLYHIIKFVDASTDIEKEAKREYTALVRAQLSSYEQALLFYNCIHPVSERFGELIGRYGLLHNLDEELLFDKAHKEFFPKEAYQGSAAADFIAPPAQSHHPATVSNPLAV